MDRLDPNNAENAERIRAMILSDDVMMMIVLMTRRNPNEDHVAP
jgi:hypothetical protein